MTRETLLLIFSILIGISPFVGLPLTVLSWILPILAFGIFAIAYQMRLRRKARRLLRESAALESVS